MERNKPQTHLNCWYHSRSPHEDAEKVSRRQQQSSAIIITKKALFPTQAHIILQNMIKTSLIIAMNGLGVISSCNRYSMQCQSVKGGKSNSRIIPKVIRLLLFPPLTD